MRIPALAAAFLLAALPIQSACAADSFKTAARSYEAGMYDSAARYWRSLAEKGHGPAQYNLGRMIYYGRGGMRRDIVEAYKWFLLASQSGVPQGRTAVALIGDKLTRTELIRATLSAEDIRRRYSR